MLPGAKSDDRDRRYTAHMGLCMLFFSLIQNGRFYHVVYSYGLQTKYMLCGLDICGSQQVPPDEE